MAAKKSAQNFVVWILMALLVVGLAGFGVDGLLSQRATSIGAVGSREISTQAYMRALQDAMRQAEREQGQAMPIARAVGLGIDQQVRAQLVTQAALEAEADRIGISVGDENVMRTVTSIGAFSSPAGDFDRDTYRFALENAGLTPTRFEEDVRREAARGILQAATAAGVDVPANLRSAILAHFATRRDISVFALDQSALETPPDAPDAAAVEAYYNANLTQFTAPEIRAFTYAWVIPDMLLDAVEVDADAVRALFDQRADDFIRPERRLVERLVFPDQASADAAAARLADGVTFEDLVTERGLSLDDTDMGDVTRSDLAAAGEAVFALTDPGTVTGPHRSSVGPAIFRMNAILSAQETPFDEVAPALRDELAADRARRRITDAFDEIEDLLAGGATVEDVAAETDMVLGQIDWSADQSEGIAGYAEFRTAAQAASANDFPEARVLSDGGLFVVRLDSITPPAPRPLDDVRDAAEAGARADALRAALTARAQALATELTTLGTEDFSETTGLIPDVYASTTRLDRLPGLPPELLEQVHAAGPGQTVIEAAGDQVYLALITDQSEPDELDGQTERLVGAIDAEIGGGLAEDVFGYFARALEREAGIRFNQPAIDAVHAAFP